RRSMPAADILVDQPGFDDPLARTQRLDIVLPAAAARGDARIAVATAEIVDDSRRNGSPGIVTDHRTIGVRFDQDEVFDGAGRRETEPRHGEVSTKRQRPRRCVFYMEREQ